MTARLRDREHLRCRRDRRHRPAVCLRSCATAATGHRHHAVGGKVAAIEALGASGVVAMCSTPRRFCCDERGESRCRHPPTDRSARCHRSGEEAAVSEKRTSAAPHRRHAQSHERGKDGRRPARLAQSIAFIYAPGLSLTAKAIRSIPRGPASVTCRRHLPRSAGAEDTRHRRDRACAMAGCTVPGTWFDKPGSAGALHDRCGGAGRAARGHPWRARPLQRRRG